MKKIVIKIFSKMFSVLKASYEVDVYNGYRKLYNLDDTFIFNGEGTLFYGYGEINIGKNSYIGRFSTLQVSKETKIQIGNVNILDVTKKKVMEEWENDSVINMAKEIRWARSYLEEGLGW